MNQSPLVIDVSLTEIVTICLVYCTRCVVSSALIMYKSTVKQHHASNFVAPGTNVEASFFSLRNRKRIACKCD